MAIKKGDFIEVDYIGKLLDSNEIFDLTKEEDAKKNKVHNPRAKYGSKKVCVGEGQLVNGLDEAFIGKDLDKIYNIELTPEKAFGKKDAKLMKIVPTNIFTKQNIRPMPGLQVNIDNSIGTIKTVSGGRTIVDFNHPLAGRDVKYEFKITKIIKDDKEKIETLINPITNMLNITPEIEVKEGNAKIKTHMKDLFEKTFKEKITKLIPSVKKVAFEEISAKV
ncbi:MAG: peptidylprolyl isomerase [Candidatus Nanoarchaeia archaeon]|nr:peptidylprolyl isomerase [Candidatus Nanoarchaeia archaeon]